MSSQVVLSAYNYDASNTYDGPAEQGVITFRGAKGTQLAIKWLMEDLIKAKCALADVTPLRAILKVSQIGTDFLDYLTDEYELTLYYHESPAVIPVIYAIAIAIAAVGFLVLAWRATSTTWQKLAEIPANIAAVPTSIASAFSDVSIALVGIAIAYAMYKSYSKETK